MPSSLPEKPPPEPSKEGPRLPMGTRISLYYIFVVFLALFVIRPLLALALLAPEERAAFLSGTPKVDFSFWLEIEALLAPLVILVTIGFVRVVDRKPLRAIGALWPAGAGGRAVRDLVASFFGAAGLLGLWYVVAGLAVEFEIGPVAPEAGGKAVTASPAELLLLALGFLAEAALYEWILRGYVYSTLREKLSWVHAGGIAALLFVLLQLVTPGIPAPGLVTAFLLGFILAAIRELTGSLWTGAVFHGSWNFVMGSILALPVSGNAVPARHSVTVTGSELWSGGEYGPEGSWLMAGLLLAAVVALAGVLSRGEESEEDAE